MVCDHQKSSWLISAADRLGVRARRGAWWPPRVVT
jgi:hypothetical protein